MYKQPFANWDGGVYEWMSMARALGVSCDTYFYQLGSRFYELGADRGQPLQRWARIFGLGEETGIDIERESTGLVPTIKWRRRNFTTALERSWKPGDSIQLSIGQKDIKVTPLQMARFYAMLANGGKLVTPHVAANVVKVGSTRTLPGLRPTLPNSVAVDPTAMQVVRDGLYQATHGDGTSAWVFDNFPVAIAGKTGTAEKTVDLGSFSGTVNQSWWCGYGPSDRTAELVVCAVIENGGHGSTAAAPAAREVFQRYFDLDPGEAGEATLVRSE